MNFNRILELNDKGIQLLLKELELSELVLALKGVDKVIIEKINNNMSDKASEKLLKDLQKIDPVSIDKIKQAQEKILVKALENNILTKKKVAMASDHAAFEMKEHLKGYLSQYYEVQDYGTNSPESMDYPDSGFKAAEAVSNGKCDTGIIMCGSGIGMSLVANKVKKIRAALCHNTDFAKLCRQHNNANIMVLPGRFISKYLAEQMADIFLNTEFEGGRHQRRINKISKYEERG